MSESLKTHKAIFMGRVIKQKYFVDYCYEGRIAAKIKDIIDYKEIETIENFNSPPLNPDDAIYLCSVKDTAKILNVVRSTDNSYVYYTTYELKDITNEEELEKSRLDVEKKIKELDDRDREYKIKRKKEKKIQEYHELPWYKKMFTKKPD